MRGGAPPPAALPLRRSVKDELDWALLRFAVSAVLSVLPLILLWLFQRFSEQGRLLELRLPYLVAVDAAHIDVARLKPNDTSPIPLIAGTTPSFYPWVRTPPACSASLHPIDAGDCVWKTPAAGRQLYPQSPP